MRVTLVPSATAVGVTTEDQFLTSFLINDTVAIDAGSLGLYRSFEEQARVRHVLLTHAHMDHLASLPMFLENVYQAGPDCVTIHASPPVLEVLRRDLFNNRLWPDFVALSEGRPPFLKLATLLAGQAVELEGLRITPVEVNHVIPTQGLIIEDAKAAVVFSADTGPTEEIWERANRLANLKGVFLEVTFPDRMEPLAEVSKHLTPAMFARELRKLHSSPAVFAVHIKPRYRAEVIRELEALHRPRLAVAIPGKSYEF